MASFLALAAVGFVSCFAFLAIDVATFFDADALFNFLYTIVAAEGITNGS